jgi:hypothetical protein
VRHPLAADQVGVQDYPEIHLSTVQKKKPSKRIEIWRRRASFTVKKVFASICKFLTSCTQQSV